MRILLVGDVVGDAGVAHLEVHLPRWQQELELDAVIANGDNCDVTGPSQ